MEIRPVEDFVAYDSFVQRHGSVFNSRRWLQTYGKSLKFYGIFDKGKSLIGVFHLYSYKKLFWRCAINPPAIPHCGLVFTDPTSNASSSSSYYKDVLTLFAAFLKKANYNLLDIVLPYGLADTQPFQWAGFKVKPRYTYLIDLSKSEAEIWDHFSSQRRKSIRKAISDDLEVRLISDYGLVITLVQKTFERQEEVIDCHLLENIVNAFADQDNAFSFVTFIEGKPAATVFCIFDQQQAYYILGGYDASHKHHGAGALAMWEAIKHAQKLGLKQFNFNGSMLPKIEEYMRDFGGILTPYFNVTKMKWPFSFIRKY